MVSQACSSDVHLSIKWPERSLYRYNNLIKFDSYMYRIIRRISFKGWQLDAFFPIGHSVLLPWIQTKLS